VRFHHVGYAVESIDQYLNDFLVPLFAPESVSGTFADEIQQVSVCFAQMQGGTVIELVEPLGPNSPVNDVIGSTRGGVYHLCYEVDDLDAVVKTFRQKRCMPLGAPVPAAAFNNRRIVFLMTPQRDLIELVEAETTPA
jgi:methylmalonyl-CoA/ethylmalonyl-CoA epimerase